MSSFDPALPTTAAPSESPLSPERLGMLFLRPRRFFQAGTAPLDHRPTLLLVLLCVGIAYASGRIDQNLIRADLGQARPGWDAMAPMVVGSWPGFWGAVLFFAILGAAGAWYIGGWWYRVRLRWSGDAAADPRAARLVYSYASFVYALPVVVALLLQTLLFESYAEAWYADELWSTLLLVFPFLSCWASYQGVRATFAVRTGAARVWFLILPALAYVAAFGVIAVLFAWLTPEVAAS
jgi:hypothetical protein